MKKKVIVVGAGPAGLSCAVELAEKGVAVVVYEAAPHVGGLSRTFELWGQKVDLGPHRFFSSDKIVNDHWMKFVGSDFHLVNRLTRIYYKNKFFFYPLQPFNAFKNLGVWDVARSVLSYAKVRLVPPASKKTFEEWVVSRFGRHLFSIFFKTYTEKVWGIPCAKIDADWAAQRIKKLSLFEAVKAALLGDRKKKHKTLVDQFAYPRGGTGVVYERMTEKIKKLGGIVRLGNPIKDVRLDDSGKAIGVTLADGTVEDADFVVSTMPLTMMVSGLKKVPLDVQKACDKLFYRNTVLVYLEVDSDTLFPDNWIYVHAPEVQHGRITNFRNWCPSLNQGKKTTILCVEFWCFFESPLWQQDASEIGALAEQEIRRIKLIEPSHHVLNTHVIKIPRSYPVYETGYMDNLGRIQKFVDSIPNLLAIGRYGAFKYNNQDHSILMGLLAAREIVTGKAQRLWDINTDSEYQESKEIEALYKAPQGQQESQDALPQEA